MADASVDKAAGDCCVSRDQLAHHLVAEKSRGHVAVAPDGYTPPRLGGLQAGDLRLGLAEARRDVGHAQLEFLEPAFGLFQLLLIDLDLVFDELAAAVVIHQQLAYYFLYAVRALRRRRGRVEHLFRQLAAEHRHRTGEHDARTIATVARLFEQDACRLQIDAHTEIEIGFGFATDHRCEMEYRSDRRRQRARNDRRICHIAFDDADARVRQALRCRAVQQHETRDRLLLAIGIGQRAARQQRSCQFHAQKTCATRDQHFHRRPRSH